jgi:hypothetical protein
VVQAFPFPATAVFVSSPLSNTPWGEPSLRFLSNAWKIPLLAPSLTLAHTYLAKGNLNRRLR